MVDHLAKAGCHGDYDIEMIMTVLGCSGCRTKVGDHVDGAGD